MPNYQDLITTAKINSLRQQFNSYPLPTSPEPLMLDLIAESEVEPSEVTFFYSQLAEVQHASDSLLDDLLLIAEQDFDNQTWQDYYHQRVQLAIGFLQNRSQLAHIADLSILNKLPAAEEEITTTLIVLTHLKPRQMITDKEVETLRKQLVAEGEVFSKARADLVKKGQDLLDQTLKAYTDINKDLAIHPTDNWNVVVGKAISLRQLGQTDEAVAAFTKYEEMFAATDPTAKQYAHVARLFTRQIEMLDIIDGAVYIFEVTEGSPAAKAGLQVGDILVEFNGYPIRNMNDFQTSLQDRPGDKPVAITILRLDEQDIFRRQTTTVIAQDAVGIGAMPI